MMASRSLRNFTVTVRKVRYASSLVVAEISGGTITLGTLSAVTAAKKIGGDVSFKLTTTFFYHV